MAGKRPKTFKWSELWETGAETSATVYGKPTLRNHPGRPPTALYRERLEKLKQLLAECRRDGLSVAEVQSVIEEKYGVSVSIDMIESCLL